MYIYIHIYTYIISIPVSTHLSYTTEPSTLSRIKYE